MSHEKKQVTFYTKAFSEGGEAEKMASLCHNEIRRILKAQNETMAEALHVLLQSISAVFGVLHEKGMAEGFFNHLNDRYGVTQENSPFNHSIALGLLYNDAIKKFFEDEIHGGNS